MLKMSEFHTASVSTHYHISGSLRHARDAHDVILHAGEGASFRVKRCDAKDVGDLIDGRCDYTDYDPETKNNLRLLLLSEPKANQFTEAVFVDLDYEEMLRCTVFPVLCLQYEKWERQLDDQSDLAC